jgi:hypothetical protein
MTVSQAHGQAPTIELSARKITGNPGDEITFNWKVTGNGDSIDRVTVRLDGEPVNWESPHTWTAIPGTHVFFIRARWGHDNSGNTNPFVLDYVKVEISGGQGHFVHPGIYNSQAELDQIKAHVNGAAPHPMKDGWQALLKSKGNRVTGNTNYSSLGWAPHPVAVVNPKSSDKQRLFDDGMAVYAQALAWVVTGKQEHADKAIQICNVWSAVFEDIVVANGDVYPSLFNSWSANNWAAGAEIIRHYNHGAAGWKAGDIAKFEDMCKVFERLTLEWMGNVGVYGCQNQILSTARTRLALGVFLDDQGLFDSGNRLLFEYVYDGSDTQERHGHAVNLLGFSVASDGEIMEFNRDAAHGTGSFNSLVNAAEILRHQNVRPEYRLYDLKLAADGDKIPRLLLGSEFCANSYVNSPTPITRTKRFVNRHSGIRYPEMILNYYKHLSPESYPVGMTEKVNARIRPMPANGYDIGWSTLTHADLSAGGE